MIDRNELKRLFQEANHRAEVHQYRGAISVYRKVLTLAGSHDSVAAECAHWGIGEVYYTMGDYPQALQALESARTINPGESAYYYLQGVIHTRIGNEAEALVALAKAVQLEPEKPKVLREYGWALHRFGYREQGMGMLHKALSLNSTDHLTFTELGLSYAAEGRYGESLVCLERALELAPGDLGISVAISAVDRFACTGDARYPIPATGPNLAGPSEEWDDEEDGEEVGEEDWEESGDLESDWDEKELEEGTGDEEEWGEDTEDEGL